jgi:hypothetical protein
MSDEKSLEERPTTDIVGKDQEKLQEFIEAGLPGIGNVEEAQIVKMFDMYLYGKTYNTISGIMHIPKPAILYLSHKLNWFQARQEYFGELEIHIKQRVLEAKLMSQDFLITLIQVWHKKIGTKMNRYLASDNEEFTNQVNLKELDRYLKTVEMLQKSVVIPSEAKAPLVGINVGAGATITRNSENEIEVTPKEKAMDGMLKHYADLSRGKK